MILDDCVCTACEVIYEDVDVEDGFPGCPSCGHLLKKHWPSARVGLVNGGQPVNSRLTNDGQFINKFFAKDDPLCAIEVGLKRDGFSGLRTFTPEQAQYFREKIQKGEDSVQLRQQILDVRETNMSRKKYEKKTKANKLIGV